MQPLLSSVKKCACPDAKISHVYQAKANDFDSNLGVNVTVKVNTSLGFRICIWIRIFSIIIKVSTIKEEGICPSTVTELADVDYSDTEIRNVLVEVFNYKFYGLIIW